MITFDTKFKEEQKIKIPQQKQNKQLQRIIASNESQNQIQNKRKAILKKKEMFKQVIASQLSKNNHKNVLTSLQNSTIQKRVLIQSFKGNQQNHEQQNKKKNILPKTKNNQVNQNVTSNQDDKQNNSNQLSINLRRTGVKKKSKFLEIDQEQAFKRKSSKKNTLKVQGPSRVFIEYTETNLESQENFNPYQFKNIQNNSQNKKEKENLNESLDSTQRWFDKLSQQSSSEINLNKSCKQSKSKDLYKNLYKNQKDEINQIKSQILRKKKNDSKIEKKKENYQTYIINIKNQSQISEKSQNTHQTSKIQPQIQVKSSNKNYQENAKINKNYQKLSIFKKRPSNDKSQNSVSILLDASNQSSKFGQTAQFFLQKPPALHNIYSFGTDHTFERQYFCTNQINDNIIKQVCLIRFLNRLMYKVNKYLNLNKNTFQQFAQCILNLKLQSLLSLKNLNFTNQNSKQIYKKTKDFQIAQDLINFYDQKDKNLKYLLQNSSKDKKLQRLTELLNVSIIEMQQYQQKVNDFQQLRVKKRSKQTLLLKQKIKTLKLIEILLSSLEYSMINKTYLNGNNDIQKLILQNQWQKSYPLEESYQIWKSLKAKVQKHRKISIGKTQT